MAELKTKVNDASAEEFIGGLESERRKEDGFQLLEIFKRATRLEPKMWGTSIIGFGMYHYKSERSSQEGDWPLVAFSPRKQKLTLYVAPNDFPDLLKKLGKHTTSVGCLYINKLADVDLKTLEDLVSKSYKKAKKEYN